MSFWLIFHIFSNLIKVLLLLGFSPFSYVNCFKLCPLLEYLFNLRISKCNLYIFITFIYLVFFNVTRVFHCILFTNLICIFIFFLMRLCFCNKKHHYNIIIVGGSSPCVHFQLKHFGHLGQVYNPSRSHHPDRGKLHQVPSVRRFLSFMGSDVKGSPNPPNGMECSVMS